MTMAPPDRPAPTFPDLAGVMLALVARIATDHAELLATVKRIEASRPARRTPPGGETLEAISDRIREQKFNPFQSSYSVDVSTTRDALCQEFGFGMRRCNELVKYWTAEGYCEARRGTGVRLFAQRRS